MQSGALGCHQVIFKLKKFASFLRSSSLFVAFSDEFKGFVLLRLLCSQSPFFALVFFWFQRAKCLAKVFFFCSLPKALIQKSGRSHCRKQLKASGADGDSLNQSVFVIWFYVMSLNDLVCLNALDAMLNEVSQLLNLLGKYSLLPVDTLSL